MLHNLWKLLTINLKDKSLHNSIDWSGFHLQVYIQPWLGKTFRFTVFRLLEKHLWNSSILGMIWSLIPHVEQQPPHKFAQKVCFPICCEKHFFRKVFPHTVDTMPLLLSKVMWGYVLPNLIWQKWRLYDRICQLVETYCKNLNVLISNPSGHSIETWPIFKIDTFMKQED